VSPVDEAPADDRPRDPVVPDVTRGPTDVAAEGGGDTVDRVADDVAATPDRTPVIEPVVVDILHHHGRVTAAQRIAIDTARPTFTIGRSVQADVLVDDPHVAPIHVEIAVSPDGSVAATAALLLKLMQLVVPEVRCCLHHSPTIPNLSTIAP